MLQLRSLRVLGGPLKLPLTAAVNSGFDDVASTT